MSGVRDGTGRVGGDQNVLGVNVESGSVAPENAGAPEALELGLGFAIEKDADGALTVPELTVPGFKPNGPLGRGVIELCT